MVIFETSVIAGGLWHMAWRPHDSGLVGMSAGCYALMAMHMADVIMNWKQHRPPSRTSCKTRNTTTLLPGIRFITLVACTCFHFYQLTVDHHVIQRALRYPIQVKKTVRFELDRKTLALQDAHQLHYYTTLKSEQYRTFACPSASMATLPSTGVPLQECRKDCPPGWAPGIPDYPLRQYFDKLKLWYRIYDGPDESVGPLVAGRLQGRAQKIALSLRLIRPDGNYDIGDSALVRLSVDEVRDPMDPNVILQHHIPSGISALATALRAAFGQSDQEMTTTALEAFFELRRGKMSLQDYAAEWELRLEEAQVRAGLELNNVAKTYLFFRNSGLPVKFIEDVKMQIHGDMSRFDEARRLSLRISSRGDQQFSTDLYASSSIGSMADNTTYEDYYQDSWDSWTWDGWHASDVYYDQWVDDHWADSAWSYDAWMREGEEEELWYDAQGTASEWHSPEHYDMAAGDEAEEAPAVEDYQGTNDDRCFVCGSKYHRAAQCPVNHGHSGPPGKGFQGKGKGKKGKSKEGFGKNRKGFKGKSKGKGKGKGKPYYYDDYYAYRRQPDHGLFATSSPTRSSSSTTTSKTIVQESPPRQVGELFAWRGSAPVEEESATTPSTPPADPAKRSLNFATTLHTSADVFHTVQGHKRRGLLIDPGAAAGLVGSETLRDIIEHCYPNAHREEAITWSDSEATITGISGQPDKALGRVHLQLPLKDLGATYTADVIGNAGSLCPALVGNPALCEMRASLHSRWFDNNDGLLVTWDTNNSVKPEMHLFRYLLTDSGHYLLPLDEQAEVPSQHYEACHFIRHLSNVSKTKWPDHAYTFWQSVTQTEADPKQKWRSDEPPKNKDTNSPKQVSFADSELTDSKEADNTFHEAEITEAVEKALDSTSEEAISTAITSSSPTEESMTKAMTPSSTSEEPVSTAIDEVFGTGFDKLPLYARDDFPSYLSSSDLTRLHKDYKAMPEEYYTRSGKRVVTPQNFNTWLGEARRKKVKWHGWDIAHPDHQKMLDQAYETRCPGFLLCSPCCKFWSISSSRRDRQELMKDRESERPALVYLQDKMYQQTIRQKIYLLEHPWSSALWTESIMTENKTLSTSQATLLAMTALTSQVHAATSEAPETTWGESWSFPFFIPLTFILLRHAYLAEFAYGNSDDKENEQNAFSYPYFGDREWHCIRCPDEICIADFTAKLETSLSPAGNPRRLETERVYQLANGTGLAWREQLSKQRERSFEPLSSNFSLAIEWMTALKAGMTSDGGMKWNEGESRMKRCSCFTGGALQLSSAQHMTRSATSHVAWMQECDVNLIAMASNLTAMASNLNAMCDYIL
ncbi:1-alkyl-2-acetylglycerophosphocholine esterase [Durusdinium trenchii]|uniref:1-alkyl-2-acetylglycerophosphocholine esterase n=1 Tax=Durusdinium trenchii TaxID=1381693 RepID=A0ABP0SHH5_9DINO